MKKQRLRLFILIFPLLLLTAKDAYCGKGGHYSPGVSGVRDFIMPPKSGLYYTEYSPYYHADAYCGNNGKKVRTLSANSRIYINNSPVDITADADIDLEIQSFGTNPLLSYVFDTDILGAKYGVYAGAYFGYAKAKVKADVTVSGTVGGVKVPGLEMNRHIEIEDSDSGIGDPSFFPLWLDWKGQHYDTRLIYGFYAPVGEYDSNKFINMGHGFWSHEILLGAAYYPQKERATAIVGNLTYEINQRQEETDVTPGQNVALEYGISQYLTPRLEACASGYSMFQVTDDSGGNALNIGAKSYVHAMGGQLSCWIIKDRFCVAGKYLYEYAARERNKGQIATFNFYYIF